jgi:hypothetical protein
MSSFEKHIEILNKQNNKNTIKNIIIITGNNLNEESGIEDFEYLENIKEKNYINDINNYINRELKYKFPNYTHEKIIEFIKKYNKEYNIKLYDQSYFNFFEQIDDTIDILKLEKDISKQRCLTCNKIYNNQTKCEKCDIDTIPYFPLLGDKFENYELLLHDIGLKKLMNLDFRITETGENQPIWTLDTHKEDKTLIIVIGYQDTLLELEVYLQDIIALDKKNIYKIFYLDNKQSEMLIDYEVKKETELLSIEIDNFLKDIEDIELKHPQSLIIKEKNEI